MINNIGYSKTYRSVLSTITGFCFVFVVAFSSFVEAKSLNSAEVFAQDVAKRAISIIDAGGSKNSQAQKFRSLLRNKSSIKTISSFSLGKYARKLPSSQKNEYYSLVEKHIAQLFLNHMGKFRGGNVKIIGSKVRGSRETVVISKLIFKDGRKPMDVNWRLVKVGSGYRVFDVSVAGVWLAVQQRTSFVSLINKNKGDVGALLKFLRK